MKIKEKIMQPILNIIQNLFIFEKEPQKIGLTQLREAENVKPIEPSIKNKDVKLSDLMRRAS